MGGLIEIVGVMPFGFRFPNNEEAWIPASLDWEVSPNDETENWTFMQVFGRLKPGVSQDAATAAISGHLAQLREEDPIFTADQEGRPDEIVHTVSPFADAFLRPEAKRSTYVMFGAALLTLLIACGNVANLLLARFAKRSKELAVRSALGAGRGGLIRLILTEAFLVTFIGSSLGIVLMLTGIRYIKTRILEVESFSSWSATAAMRLPEWVEFGVDARVVVFIVGVVLFSGLASGIFPAWRALRTDIVRELNDESRAASNRSIGHLSRLLVVGQIALTTALMVGMGLTMRTLHRLHNVNFNLNPHNILTLRVALDKEIFQEEFNGLILAFQTLLDALEAHPDVIFAATARQMPMASEYGTQYSLEGVEYPEDTDFPSARFNTVSSHYLKTLRVSLLQGRWFDRTDTPDRGPVTVVNNLLAEKSWPGEDPIGKRISLHWGQPNWREEAVWHTVVGVVPDLKMRDWRQGRSGARFVLPDLAVWEGSGESEQQSAPQLHLR